jgi:hypothetical protein
MTKNEKALMAAHLETGTMVYPQYSSKPLDHLGLVTGNWN